MDIETRTAKAKHLAKTIMDDLVALLSANISSEQSDDAGIAEALKQNVDKITCFSDLHDYMEDNATTAKCVAHHPVRPSDEHRR